jgi:hypothetical protein
VWRATHSARGLVKRVLRGANHDGSIQSWLRRNDSRAFFVELLESSCDALSIWHPAFLEEDPAVWGQGKIWPRNAYEEVTDRVNGQGRKERKHHRFVSVDGTVAFPERTVT